MTVKTKFHRVFLRLVLMSSIACSNVIGANVVFDKSDEGLRTIVAVGEDVLTVAGIEQAYKDLVSEQERSKLTFLTISAFENIAAASRYIRGKGHTEITYAVAVKQLLEARSRNPVPMLRLVSIGGNTVIQKTDGLTISRPVMRGKDPTLFSAGEIQCELLEVYFNRLPRAVRADGHNPVLLHVYLKTTPLPKVQQAEEVTRLIQQMLGHTDAFINMRADTWFLEDERFPVWYPFAPARKPPTYEEYKSRGETFCIAVDTKIRCDGVRIPGR